MKFRFSDGTVTAYGRVTHDGIAYNLPGMTEEDRAAVGDLVEVDARPDDRWYVVTDGAVELDGETWRQRWTATPRLIADVLALRVADVKAEAQRRIVIRSGATSFEPCLTKQLNAAMRAASDDIEADLTALAGTDDFAGLIAYDITTGWPG